MTHWLDGVDVILLVWLIVSALITPLVGRFLGHLSDGPAEDSFDPIATKLPHDSADA